MRLEVARVGRAHGLRGEVAVTFISNRPERTKPGTRLYAGDRELVIGSAREHQKRWLIHFDGIEDRTDAEHLLGQVLTAEPLYDEGALWVHDLVGAVVVDGAGRLLGTVTAVEANPAHDLLVLDGGPLIPMVFVTEHGNGRVVVEVPDGLLDL
jgi:16S rRNA processing protein RimM